MVSTEAGHHWMIIAAVFVGLISAVSSQGVDQCASNPCVRGECEDFFNTFFVCFCGDTGYTGPTCDTPITPCDSNPCQNGGTCEIYLDVAYVCQCPSTYQGDICTEVITDPTPEATTDPTSEATTPTSLTTLFSGAADDICGTVPSGRIVGGTDAALGRYPWQGRLVSEEYTCGLSLINNEWAVTAAHCVTKEIEVTVIGAAFGYVNADDLSSFQETPIDRIYLHPGYNDLTFENDIALLHLDPPVNYTTNVRPICLETSDTEQELYDTCFTSGYGLLQINGGFPETLQEVELDLLEKGECVELNVTDNQICAGASQKGICPGDSGGPLACQRSDGRFSLVGITSFLVPVNDSCGESSSAFTRVSQYNDFIGNVIRNRDTTPNCEPIASQMCADVLPYSDTYVTSQEDFFEPLASLVANTTDECRPRVIRFWCAHTFQECSEDPGTERVQLCLQECISFAEECARSPEEVAQFSSLCLPLPLAEDPNQEYCPYGPDPVCSGHFNLTGDPTLLTSPNYPDVYFPLAQCQWTISAPEGYQILLKRVTFDTEENFDNVVIGTGLDPEDRPSALTRFSGQLAPKSRILDTNEMWIVFAPLNGFQRSGFQYELIAVQNESECSNNTFQCPGENYCIPQRWTCDNVADCKDGADEAEEMCSSED